MIIAEPPKPSLTTLPPELLYQILSAVIDVPYVLDTILPTETCYWHWHPLSHDISEYNRSESQREILRLVCRSWKSYADMSQFRWLSFVDGSQLAKHRKNYRIVERALADADSSQHDKGEDSITRGFNKPRRMDLQIGTQDAYNLTCKLITLLGIKLTTLFISCSAEHASPMFNHLISSRSALPNLRSLMLTHVNFTKTPLQTISIAFPRLIALTFTGGIFPPNEEDYLDLPELESLYLSYMPLEGLHPEKWKLPRLLRLLIPIVGTNSDVGFNFLQTLGKNLIFLRLDSPPRPITLPKDLWSFTPLLKELVARLSSVALPSPIPPSHPLRYVVSISTNANTSRPPRGTHATLLQNINLLNNGLKILIIARLNWETYLYDWQHSLSSGDGEGGQDIPPGEGYLEEVERICLERGIRLEDECWKTREEFLKHVGEKDLEGGRRNTPKHGLAFEGDDSD